MKTIFKIFGLEEREIVLSAWLTSTGIQTEDEFVVFRKHVGDFDSEFEALKFIEETEEGFEHGFEIVKTIQFVS